MFEHMLMQVAESTFATDTTALIIAIGSIVGVVGSLALGVLNRTGVFKNKEALTDVAKFAITFGQKTVENQQQIKTGLDVGYNLTPEEQQKALESARAHINKLESDINASKAQLNRLKPIIVKDLGTEADPDTDSSLPR